MESSGLKTLRPLRGDLNTYLRGPLLADWRQVRRPVRPSLNVGFQEVSGRRANWLLASIPIRKVSVFLGMRAGSFPRVRGDAPPRRTFLGMDHGRRNYRPAPGAVEQGEVGWPEVAVQAKGDLGHPNPAPNGRASQGACLVQPGNRQQATRLRSDGPTGPGYLPREPGCQPGNRASAQNATSSPVRNYAHDPGNRSGLDPQSGSAGG